MTGRKIIVSIFTTLFVSIAFLATSQTINEAGEKFNAGIEKSSAGDVAGAIQAYQETIGVCDQLGEEGADLKQKSEKQLGVLYLKSGLTNYKAKKFSEAEKELKTASDYAEKAGDAKTKATANGYIARVNYSKGLGLLKKKEVDKAKAALDEVLKYDPKYYKAYYGLALVYKAKKDPDNLLMAVQKVTEMGGDDSKTINKTKSIAGKYFLSAGSKALKAKDYNKAITDLNESVNYITPKASTYYYLAIANNSTSKWDAAVEAAKKGLEIETEDKSNLNFELGKAYEGKGDKANACSAYKNVISGPNAEAAKYKVETELKCN